MDLRNMRQLLAVRTHGSFAKAAQALGMSQPSLSSAILRMEDQLRVKLFERTAMGSQLTPIGELITERANKVVAETEQMLRDAELVAGGEAGAIHIGIGTTLRDNFMPEFVRRVTRRYPALSIRVEMLDRDRLLPLLKSRELDLAICAFGDDVAPEGLLATEVLTTEAVAVVHPDHPLAQEAAVSTRRFAEFTGGGASIAEFNNTSVLKVMGEGDALSRYRSNDYDVLLEIALDGRATLIAPLFVVEPYLASGRLKLVDLDWETYRVSFAAITTRAASYSPIVSRIIREAEMVGESLPRGRA